MKILQVKEYHRLIANPKYQESINRWKTSNTFSGFPCPSMFFFNRKSETGDIKRLNGYVAFDENKSVLGKNEEEAIKNFNK